jgi:hypothetical protein
MGKYRYDLVDGHIIFRANERVILLDTGSPSSIGATEELAFEGKRFPLQGDYFGVGPDALVELAGFPFDVVMGMDIMELFDIHIEPAENRIDFGRNLCLPGSIEIPLDLSIRLPIMELKVSGDVVPLLFDTGAKISYIAPHVVSDLEPLTEKEDFFPSFGKFRTPIYELPASVGNHELNLQFGVLPVELQRSIIMSQIKGVIGSQMFSFFSCMFSIRRHVIYFSQLHNGEVRQKLVQSFRQSV